MEHGTTTDKDLARTSGSNHPATQQASPGVPTWSAARRGRSAARNTHSSPSDSGGEPRPEDATSRTTRGSSRSGPAEDRAQPVEERSRRTGHRSGPTTSIRSTGGALIERMTVETLLVRADTACVILTPLRPRGNGIDSF